MRMASKTIILLACASFLSVTLGGLHLHADSDRSGHSKPHEHVHDLNAVASFKADHEINAVDVSIFEPAIGFSTINVCGPVYEAAIFSLPQTVAVELWKDAPRIAPRRYLRFRPSLRAPPKLL